MIHTAEFSLAFPHYPRPRGTEPRTQKELESVRKEGEMPKKGERPQNEQGRLGINQPPAHFIFMTLQRFSFSEQPLPDGGYESLDSPRDNFRMQTCRYGAKLFTFVSYFNIVRFR
jgi:hypothetical protein